MRTDRTAVLKKRILQLRDAIAGFERRCAEIRRRRRGATDGQMVVLDECLVVHVRTMDCLQRSLELAEADLRRETTLPSWF